MKDTAIVTTAYLPPVQYFTKLFAYRQILVEQYDHYMKQTYRNRCIIAAADGPLALTVPIVKPDDPKCPMKDIRISDHGNWRHLHWNALSSAYMNSPFFEYYEDDFRPFYEKKWEFLMDYNEALVDLICRDLDLQPNLSRTHEYRMEIAAHESDFREMIHPKRGFETDVEFIPVAYYQVFKDRYGFQPNLSIVDLLFNEGPEGLVVLRDSVLH